MHQLYCASLEVIEAMKPTDVFATCDGLKRMGMFKLPYPSVSFRMPLSVFQLDSATQESLDEGIMRPLPNGRFRYTNSTDWFEWIGLNLDGRDVRTRMNLRGSEEENPLDEKDSDLVDWWTKVLIALLSTRNVGKATQEDKLAKLGIGKRSGRHRYRYVTTLTLPARLERGTAEEVGSGRELKAHWRSGHVRNQRYGPARAFSEMKWIEPVYVNADKEFIGERTAYNMTLGRKRLNAVASR